VATDVICGFPGETDEAFEKTLKLIEEVKPDVVNISKFFARPKTPAAEMVSSVPFHKINERSAILARLAKEIAFEKNQRWVGWEGEILVDETGKVKGSWVGRNFAYKPVVIREGNSLFGKTVRVQIVEASSTYLIGKLI
ncbi:MAG: TRAM domain-containing protein, partial [Candidatus Bathyarchaeia archaeon]